MPHLLCDDHVVSHNVVTKHLIISNLREKGFIGANLKRSIVHPGREESQRELEVASCSHCVCSHEAEMGQPIKTSSLHGAMYFLHQRSSPKYARTLPNSTTSWGNQEFKPQWID